MDRQVAWSGGRDSGILQAQAEVAAFGGQIHKSRDLWRRAIEILERDGAREARANELSSEAVFEAQVGNLPEAREAVKAALGLARGQSVLYRAALVEAFGGSAGPTQKLLDELLRTYPQATLVNRVAVPVVQAALEISRGNSDRAVALLETAAAYELGYGIGCRQVLYLRGQAQLRAGVGKDAAEAFKKILDHRGVFIAGVYPLAYLGLGRAQALAGNTAEARKAYRGFLALWKDADPDIPILTQAQAEYSKLP
jgi:tetratricopeptide (TPR) repeat protein